LTEIRKAGVVGGGALAAGISQLCLQAGLEVLLVDDSQEALDDTEGLILRGLHRAEQPAAFGLLRKATRLARLEECDLAIECACDAPEAKQDLLCRMDARLEPGKPLCVQTAALPVGIAARMVENPDRVAGIHFLVPASVMELVEVIAGVYTSVGTLAAVTDFVARLGRTAVRCKDSPGFVVSRLARPFYRASLRLLEEGSGTPAGIDAALRAGGVRAGPFEALDFYGLGEDLAVAELIYELLERPERLKPAVLQKEMVARGATGRREGRGFFIYGEGGDKRENPVLRELLPGMGLRPAEPGETLRRVVGEMLREAHALVSEGVAEAKDVDAAARLALHWPKGPFEWEGESKP